MDISKNCQICLTPADDDTKYYFHYGAICCLGCKAFFRRVYRDEIQTTFVCKRQEKCNLKIARCKHCRLKKCLQVGLDPKKILSVQDRKKFSHSTRKTKKSKSESQAFFDTVVQNTDISSLKEDLTLEYNAASRSVKISENITAKIIHGHSFEEIQKDFVEAVKVGLLSFDNVAKNFMSKNHCFNSLPDKDQRFLMEQNGSIYKAFIWARYFNCNNGYEQLTILLRADLAKFRKLKQ